MNSIDPNSQLQLTAHRDQILGEVDLVAWVPGPAGCAEIRLGDGAISWFADYATPGLLASVSYPIDAPAVPELLDVLTNGQGQALAGRIDAVRESPKIVWRSHQGQRPREFLDSNTDIVTSISLLAVLLSDLESLDHPLIHEAAGWLEFGARSLGLPPELRIAPSPVDALERGLGLLSPLLYDTDGPQSTSAKLGNIDPHFLYNLVDLLTEADDNHDWLTNFTDEVKVARLSHRLREDADRLIAIADTLEDSQSDVIADMAFAGHVDADIATSALRSATPHTDYPQTGSFVVPTRVIDLDDIEVVRVECTTTELQVRCVDHSPEDRPKPRQHDAPFWLRVYRQNEQRLERPLLLAMAPFCSTSRVDIGSSEHSGGTFHTAIALLPTAEDPTKLVAEITSRPAALWQSDDERSVRYAVALGQRASRAHRRQETWIAEETWNDVVGAWERLGDKRRSLLAKAFADNTSRSTRPQQFGTDAILRQFPRPTNPNQRISSFLIDDFTPI